LEGLLPEGKVAAKAAADLLPVGRIASEVCPPQRTSGHLHLMISTMIFRSR
jgi:hypothetical protein